MPARGDLIVVHFVEPVMVGARFVRTRNTWPLHITLVPWFSATDEAAVVTQLQEVATASEPFLVQVGAERAFGPQQEIPVHIIEPNDQPLVRKLHEQLTATLRQLLVTFESERWMGEHFTAHITHHQEPFRARREGEHLTVEVLHLVRLEEHNVCEIVRQFRLGATA